VVLLAEQILVHMSRVEGKFETALVCPLRGPDIDSSNRVLEEDTMLDLGRKCSELHQELLGESIQHSVLTVAHDQLIKAIDVEWLLLKESNQILLIQARPCKAVYN
jgi:hypothetical protein